MRKFTLSKTESSEILEFASRNWPKSSLPEKLRNVNVVELDDKQCLLIGEDFLAVRINENVMPLLANEEVLKSFPSISVDMGAVKFVCNGAKVMRPGIVRMGEFNVGDLVVVKDDKHGKFLAIGIALASSKEALTMTKGPVIDNLHYVGDKFWQAYKEGS